MTVAWADIKEALADFVVSTRVVVTRDQVSFANEPTPIVYDDAVELRISAERAIGYDDVELVEVMPGVHVPRITGIREFVVSFRFNSRSQTTAARNALERVRASLQHPGRAERLDDAGIAFLSSESIATFDAVEDQRWASIAVLDARFSVVSELFEPDDDEGVEVLDSVSITTHGQTFTVPE